MSSMDAEAEMEGLFGGEEQEPATQSLTQEGERRTLLAPIRALLAPFCYIVSNVLIVFPEREAEGGEGGANLDLTGGGGEGEKKKRTV